jgi:hypothetical protein
MNQAGEQRLHWLALEFVEVDGEEASRITYVREPFGREPDFGVTSVNYKLTELLAKGGLPR